MPTLRRSLPLALTIAVHLLIAALLLARRPPSPSAPAGTDRYMLVLVRPAPPPAVRPPIPIRELRAAAAPRPGVRVAPRPPAAPSAPVAQQASIADELAAAPAAAASSSAPSAMWARSTWNCAAVSRSPSA